MVEKTGIRVSIHGDRFQFRFDLMREKERGEGIVAEISALKSG